MYKKIINLVLIMTALFITVPYANAATWLSSHNKLGNIIYFDADTIQKKDNAIFYYVKYYEDEIKDYSKVLIMSEGNHPFVLGDPIAFENYYFMVNMDDVNERVMNYIKNKDIPEVSPDNDLNYLLATHKPYARSVILKVLKELKFKSAYENSRASVMIKINKQGEVKKVYINKSSGNQKLNKDLIKIVEKVSPFDALPEEYSKTFAILWIDVTFREDDAIILMNSAVSLWKTRFK